MCSLKQWKNIKRHLKVVCEKFRNICGINSPFPKENWGRRGIYIIRRLSFISIRFETIRFKPYGPPKPDQIFLFIFLLSSFFSILIYLFVCLVSFTMVQWGGSHNVDYWGWFWALSIGRNLCWNDGSEGIGSKLGGDWATVYSGYGPFVRVVGRGLKCVCDQCVSHKRNRNRRWKDFGDTLAMLLM